MGVPHFYTWLVNRFPLAKSTYTESTQPNVDWFFLDLNGVIYKCVTDDSFAFRDMIKGKRFEEIFALVLNYMNEIVQHISPQKMLFLAFDGVAPKAKMNQQRARRFKSAKKYMELDNALRSFGIIDKEEHFKNNSISPGTEFMFELSNHMQFFIQRKMKEDERWRRLQVIFSGVEVPGEGEHKILDFLRHKVQEPRFNPNTTVCIYGPDADLIMLALTTHLPFVCIVREQLKPRSKNASACKRATRKETLDFIWINVLRQYFEIEFSPLKDKMQERYNVEKIIDDFIFLCFFIGNDFLPRVFCMDIKIGNFDKLIEIFKENLIESDGYINEKGVICWYRAVRLFKRIAEFELKFIGDKLQEQEVQQRQAARFLEPWKEEDIEEANKEFLEEVEELKKSYEEGNDEDNKPVKLGLQGVELLKELEETQEQERGTPKKLTPRVLLNENKEKTKDEKFREDLLNAGVANVEEAERYLIQASNEEKIAKLLSARVLEKDIKFMSSLVKIYQSNSSDARKYYYEEKYRINIEKNPHELTPILTAYMQGLQFVLSYYYTGCPSWLWYYPYYYSPLVSDLSNLMTHLNLPHVTDNLITFDNAGPYDPYKQLLLILPIGSSHLLPEPLRGVVGDPNAPLHKYYPLEFEVDPFGAVFESEYIAKIPYVDEELLESEYRKAVKVANLSSEEQRRNRLGENYVYEWHDDVPEINVKSSLPLYYEDFNARIKLSSFHLHELPFDPKKVLDRLPNGCYPYHGSFPSLHYLPDKQIEMHPFQKRDVTFYKCCMKLSEPPIPDQSKDYRKFLDRSYNSLYPFLVKSVVIGIITPETLLTNLRFSELPFSYSKPDHKEFYEDIVLNIHDKYFSEYGIIFEKEKPTFVVVSCISEFRKDSLGGLYCPEPLIDIFPLDLLISSQFTGRYRGTISYSSMNLSTEFKKSSEVMVNMGEFMGSIAQVQGYTPNSFDFDEVEVKVIKTVPDLSRLTKDIAAKYDHQYNYRSVQGIAKQIGVDMGVIYQILDSVVIKTLVDEGEKSVYPDRFDLGLSLIQRKNHTIVPELIICHELEMQSSRSRSFPHFQLSAEAAQLILEYYHQFKEVFFAIARKIQTNDPSILTAEFVYPNSRDPNLELLKVYIWLIKLDVANLVLANKASKVLTREGVQELEETLDKQNWSQNGKKMPTKELHLNPNFLIPKYESTWIPPLYYKKPFWHKIGDRIVNLKINGNNYAPFGATGTVIGILGNKPENGVLEVKVEVLFDQPFLGGSNLGGRCKWGRGAIVDFDDIFNLSGWDKFVKPRDRRKNLYFQGWDGRIGRSYVPTFQVAPETEESKQEEEKKAFSVLTRKLQETAPVQEGVAQQQTNPATTQNIQSQLASLQNLIQSQGQGQNPGSNQTMEHLKQFQAFIQENQDPTQPQNQAHDQQQQAQLRQLYEFTVQIQGNEQNAGQTKANTFIPKTLGLKQNPAGPTNPQAEKPNNPEPVRYEKTYEPKPKGGYEKERKYDNRKPYEKEQPRYEPKYEQKYEQKKNAGPKEQRYEEKQYVVKSRPQNNQSQPQAQGQGQQGQGSFNFNDFLSSNLNNLIQPQTQTQPQVQTTNLNENSLKEALNIGQGQTHHPKKKLNVGSTTFAGDHPHPQGGQSQQQDIVKNLFTNPGALGLNVPVGKDETHQPATQVDLQNFMSNLGLQGNNTAQTQDQNNFQNLIAGLGSQGIQIPTQGVPVESNKTGNQNLFDNLIQNLGPSVNISQEKVGGQTTNLEEIEKNYQGGQKDSKDTGNLPH